MSPNADENALIRQAARGNENARKTLFERFRSMVYGIGWRVLSNHEDALEVVQETFVKVFNRLDTFEERSSLKTWIVRVATNAALDLRRARRARPDMGAPEIRFELKESPGAESPPEEAQKRELVNALRLCMERLSASLASVVTLVADGGLSYSQVAGELGIAQGTVMSRLFYARRKLMECLEKKGVM